MAARGAAPPAAGAANAHPATTISTTPTHRAAAVEPGRPPSSIAWAVARGRNTFITPLTSNNTTTRAYGGAIASGVTTSRSYQVVPDRFNHVRRGATRLPI